MSNHLKKLTRKSGIRKRQKLEDQRTSRDQRIWKEMKRRRRASEHLHRLFGKSHTPLSRYFPMVSGEIDGSLAQFPMNHWGNGYRMPEWEELSPEMKTKITTWAMEEYGSLKFDIHIHENITRKCKREGLDVRAYVRDRIRKELANHPKIPEQIDFWFVVEGNRSGRNAWTGFPQSRRTKLHLHGIAVIHDLALASHVEEAIARGCGQGVGKNSIEPRSIHTEIYQDRGGTASTYAFKYKRSRDERLPERRVAFSRGATQAGKMFWEGLIGRWANNTDHVDCIFKA